MNRIVVAGNWKMNLGPREAETFLDAFLPGFRALERPQGLEVVLFPPALSLDAARRRLDAGLPAHAAERLFLGVQQIHPESSGAFTGENAGGHAREAGATLALAGHSERRILFHESDDQVARRVQAALDAGLAPMLCVGETLAERKEGRLEEVLARQLDAVLAPPALRAALAEAEFTLAYEPVWAIGTGETATPADAAHAHTFLRARIRERLGEARGGAVPILYGGSVKPDNVAELLAAEEVGGVLVGGASLDPEGFLALVTAGADRARR
jgi:triosephosphate isomerase (TIM)